MSKSGFFILILVVVYEIGVGASQHLAMISDTQRLLGKRRYSSTNQWFKENGPRLHSASKKRLDSKSLYRKTARCGFTGDTVTGNMNLCTD